MKTTIEGGWSTAKNPTSLTGLMKRIDPNVTVPHGKKDRIEKCFEMLLAYN